MLDDDLVIDLTVPGMKSSNRTITWISKVYNIIDFIVDIIVPL